MLLYHAVLFISAMPISPPINSVFVGKSHFLVGEQKISLSVSTPQDAYIDMSGIVNAKGSLKYTVNDDQTINFEMSDHISKVLRRYKCEIRHAVYAPDKQLAKVHLHVYKLISHTMHLHMKSS